MVEQACYVVLIATELVRFPLIKPDLSNVRDFFARGSSLPKGDVLFTEFLQICCNGSNDSLVVTSYLCCANYKPA